ncbi:MAG: 50S ribosomal protein L32 [Planctomycetaceae bacterium]|nr:50S ribosomal protein L32 [Planctomycetaceae bacterium]
MNVPKRRCSKARTRKRRSHNAIKPIALAKCSQCGTFVPTHVVCPTCGYYQGRSMSVDDEE